MPTVPGVPFAEGLASGGMGDVPERGVLALAYGHRRYHRQAYALALSLQLHSPGLHRTLVTDDVRCPATEAYDAVIPVDAGLPDDCGLKLNLDKYAPYPCTLYVDVDSLAVRPIEPVFDLFDESDVGVVGRDVTAEQGEVWYGDVASMCRTTGTTWLPKCNSGLMLIRATHKTHGIFVRARQLVADYGELGLHTFRGGIADEPLLAMALAEEGVHAQDLTAVAAATPIGISGPLRVNVLAGTCTFAKNGDVVEPALIHFAADYSSEYRLAGAAYRRERCALRLAQGAGVPNRAARLLAGLRYGLQSALLNTWIRMAGRAPRDPSGFFDEPAADAAVAVCSATKQSSFMEENP